MTKIIRYITVIMLIFLLSCDDKPTSPTSSSDFTQMNFANIQENHQKPSKVQYLFSLRDQDSHAILLNEAELSEMDIYVLEDGLAIDSEESSPLLHTSDNFQIDLVFVLDFTQSLIAVDGVDEMISGLEAVLNTLGESHRVAIVEFHDNNQDSNYSTIQEFTTDKIAALESVKTFSTSSFYSGFSTAWDAANLGLGFFPEEIDPNTIRTLVVLSDGNDNSSDTLPADITTQAVTKQVQIYNLVFGNPTFDNTSLMEDMSEQSGGQFYQTDNINYLTTQFEKIIIDLGGNYKVSYTTPKNAQFNVAIDLEYNNITTTTSLSGDVDGTAIYGDNRQGLISFSDPTISNGNLEFYISADHIPRGITQLRFRPSTVNPTTIRKVTPEEGGILTDWSEPTVAADGYFESNGSILNFGDFGLLFKVTIQVLSPLGLTIPIAFDNSIYNDDVIFYGGDENELLSDIWYHEIQFGTVVTNPNPMQFQEDVELGTEFSWEIENLPDTTSVQYKIFLDDVVITPTTLITDFPIDSLHYQPIFTLVDTTQYYWRVNYLLQNPSDEMPTEIRGPVWTFKTLDSNAE